MCYDWYMCLFIGLVHKSVYVVLRICLYSVVCTCKSLRVRVCICCVGIYMSMFSCKNMYVFCERIIVGTCVSLFG